MNQKITDIIEGSTRAKVSHEHDGQHVHYECTRRDENREITARVKVLAEQHEVMGDEAVARMIATQVANELLIQRLKS